jgi:hypothetical protein
MHADVAERGFALNDGWVPRPYVPVLPWSRNEGTPASGGEGLGQREHGTLVGVLDQRADGDAPTRWVGLSGVWRSGWAASRAWSSRKRWSYSVSDILGRVRLFRPLRPFRPFRPFGTRSICSRRHATCSAADMAVIIIGASHCGGRQQVMPKTRRTALLQTAHYPTPGRRRIPQELCLPVTEPESTTRSRLSENPMDSGSPPAARR